MVDVAKNLLAIKAQLPEGVELTAVSKFHPTSISPLPTMWGSAYLAKAMSRNLPVRPPRCPKTSIGTLSDTYRPTR